MQLSTLAILRPTLFSVVCATLYALPCRSHLCGCSSRSVKRFSVNLYPGLGYEDYLDPFDGGIETISNFFHSTYYKKPSILHTSLWREPGLYDGEVNEWVTGGSNEDERVIFRRETNKAQPKPSASVSPARKTKPGVPTEYEFWEPYLEQLHPISLVGETLQEYGKTISGYLQRIADANKGKEIGKEASMLEANEVKPKSERIGKILDAFEAKIETLDTKTSSRNPKVSKTLQGIHSQLKNILLQTKGLVQMYRVKVHPFILKNDPGLGNNPADTSVNTFLGTLYGKYFIGTICEGGMKALKDEIVKLKTDKKLDGKTELLKEAEVLLKDFVDFKGEVEKWLAEASAKKV